MEHLENLKMKGMATVLQRHIQSMPGDGVDAESLAAQMMSLHEQRLTSRLRQASFKEAVQLDRIDWKHARGMRN